MILDELLQILNGPIHNDLFLVIIFEIVSVLKPSHMNSQLLKKVFYEHQKLAYYLTPSLLRIGFWGFQVLVELANSEYLTCQKEIL